MKKIKKKTKNVIYYLRLFIKEWKPIIILVAIISIFVIIVANLSNHPELEPGVYIQPGKCPVCQEQLTKYCYGHYGPHFIYSCANGCEDKREN